MDEHRGSVTLAGQDVLATQVSLGGAGWRRLLAVLGAVCSVVALGACGGGGGGGGGGEDPVRDRFDSRAPLAECDPVVLELAAPVRLPQEALACLAAPLDGSARDAELRVDVPTAEGDPIVHYFRTHSGRSDVEVFVDPSADEFSDAEGRRWQHCDQPFPPELGCP